MQNKGFVKVFSVLLTLVCLFYLSFSFVSKYYDGQAAKYAGGDLEKESYYLDSLATQKVWFGYTLKQCHEMEITLGLDLEGGMNVILELNVADVLRSLSGNNQDPNFNKALDLAFAHQAASQKDFIDLFVEEFRKLSPNTSLASLFSTFELKDKITLQKSDAEVISILRSELKSAIDNSFNVLSTRIDRFGVVSPNIQRLETTGRILVELPGVKEPERIRKLLQGSANLEFWETYDLTEIYQQLIAADNLLAKLVTNDSIKAELDAADSTAAAADTTSVLPAAATASADSTETKAGNDLLAKIEGGDSAKMAETASAKEFAKEHPLFSILQLNQYNGQLAPGAVVGIAHHRDRAKIDEYLNLKQVKDVLPRNLVFKWGVKAVDDKEQFYELYAIKVSNRDGSPALGGNVVTDASADFASKLGRSEQEVSMSMNAEGAKAWARLTKENIGRSIAIVLDELVYSAPRVNDEITGGRSSITGHFTPEEAKDLANVLKSGKMAASIHIVQEDVVGPSLGQEAIQSGLISFLLALVIIMVYFCVVYGFIPGLIADGALLVNVFFTMGILASFQAVLTLPGIAGMVLTFGMSLDANVLIYERTKEELRGGKSVGHAIQEGYKQAFSAIFDGNVTAIITGVVLLFFGTGPIKGFATTLIIGLSASFLTTVFLTHIVYEALLSKGKLQHQTFDTKLTRHFLVNPNFDFLGRRKIGYLIPVAIIVLGAISLATIGLNNGIDFTGGRNYIVRFDKPVNTEDIRAAMDEQLEGTVNVITIGSSNQVRISTNYKIEENNTEVDREIVDKLYQGLKPWLPETETVEQFVAQNIMSSQKVGPSMADDIKTNAVIAVIIAMFCMALYILISFRDFAFSVGVFVSVVICTLCIIAFYSLLWKILPFSMEVDQTFIAAILTVIGYSINDTVVVFDRIRETIKLYPKRDRFQVINDSLNSTLSRTFNTSFSTFLTVLCIFALGGSTIQTSTFAILIGIVVSTYCTLFIATPIAYEIQKDKIKKHAVKEVEAK
ncbi:protein translocase subunit SecDF [Parabacteroides sp. Marseille-P3160]|uniref:protein translocase subunit SecDF n=1 Tax=Parabacteroides sp. Marseille-P3160 TaxID=1917887 RepID=UPI0009BB81EA|nr:protein translocase subunit SecDF [Parabacteroides sp. Marseille-P3160]